MSLNHLLRLHKLAIPNLARTMANFVIEPSKMKHVITPELEKLVSLFKKYNYEVRIAGGAVRDLLSGEKIPEDVDLATVATPQQMKVMFAKESIRTINEQGEKHGTVTVRIDDRTNFEVTTLRIDKVTDGRHAEVEFTTDWVLDSERRDLTINSMFLSMDGTVHDFFNGKEDLEKKRIAFVGSADARIKEDYLRILRYFRFYGRIGDSSNDNHEEVTMEAIRQNAVGLQRISGERIWSEWKKILSGPMGGPLTIKMVELGLSPYIGLPENPDVQELQRIWDLQKNTLHYVTLLSHLLRSQDEMNKLNLRLKMSAYERDLGMFLLQHRDAVQTLKYWQKVFIMTKLKPASVREWIVEAMRSKNMNDLVLEFQQWEVPYFPISGSDLKAEGVSPGKSIGFCLNFLKEAWIDSDFSLDRDHLLKVELPKACDAYFDLSPRSRK